MDWINLLHTKNYAELDQKLNHLQKDFEEGLVSEKDFKKSLAVFHADKNNSVENALRLDDWVRSYPDSYAARLVRGLYLANDGYMRRGAARADDVKMDQWHGMFKSFNEARNDLQYSLSLTEKPVFSYLSLMEMEMAGGTENRKHLIEEYYQKVIAVYPLSFEVRVTKLMTLRAEWGGGTLEPMKRFLEEENHKSLSQEQQNELLAIRYGCEGHWYEGFQNNPEDGLRCFEKAIATFPKSYFYVRRAGVYIRFNNIQAAKKDLLEAERLGINGDFELLHASVTYFILGDRLYFGRQYKEAIRFLERAIELNPNLHEAKAFLALRLYARDRNSKRGQEVLHQAIKAGNERAKQWQNLFSGNWYTWLDFHVVSFFDNLRIILSRS